jgi:small-conductance mechanosensitive channel
VLWVAQALVFQRVRIDVADNRRARRLRTQVSLLRNLGAGLVVVLAVAGALMTFARLRTFGASLLASAGIVGLVAGVASQNMLSNVFAGLQLAFTDTLRIDDVVVVEGEWGNVEALSLLSVTVHLWDERRLVLPTSYFTTEPFQNWTRHEARVLGSVLIYVDYAAPLPELRRQVRAFIEGNPLWDRKDWVLQVVDSTPTAMQIRILASSADAPSGWDLRCDIREFVLTWLRENAPEGLPRVRAVGVESGDGRTEPPLVIPDREHAYAG